VRVQFCFTLYIGCLITEWDIASMPDCVHLFLLNLVYQFCYSVAALMSIYPERADLILEFAGLLRSKPIYSGVCHPTPERADLIWSKPIYSRVCRSTLEQADLLQSEPVYSGVSLSTPEWAYPLCYWWECCLWYIVKLQYVASWTAPGVHYISADVCPLVINQSINDAVNRCC